MLHAQTNSLKKLTFRNKVCAADKKIFAKVVAKMNERAAAHGQKVESFIHKLEANLRN